MNLNPPDYDLKPIGQEFDNRKHSVLAQYLGKVHISSWCFSKNRQRAGINLQEVYGATKAPHSWTTFKGTNTTRKASLQTNLQQQDALWYMP